MKMVDGNDGIHIAHEDLVKVQVSFCCLYYSYIVLECLCIMVWLYWIMSRLQCKVELNYYTKYPLHARIHWISSQI